MGLFYNGSSYIKEDTEELLDNYKGKVKQNFSDVKAVSKRTAEVLKKRASIAKDTVKSNIDNDPIKAKLSNIRKKKKVQKESTGFFYTAQEEEAILNGDEYILELDIKGAANNSTFGTDPDGGYATGGSSGSTGGGDAAPPLAPDDSGSDAPPPPEPDAGGGNGDIPTPEGEDNGDTPPPPEEGGEDVPPPVPEGDGDIPTPEGEEASSDGADAPPAPDDAGGGDGDIPTPEGEEGSDDDIPTPEGEEDSEDGGEGEEEKPIDDQIKEVEKELFASVSPAQMKEKIYKLKRDYMDLYETTVRLSDDLIKIPRNSNTQVVLDFLTKKIAELKSLVSYNMLKNFDNKSYIENTISYQECLAALNSINTILEELNKNNPEEDEEEEIEDPREDLDFTY